MRDKNESWKARCIYLRHGVRKTDGEDNDSCLLLLASSKELGETVES